MAVDWPLQDPCLSAGLSLLLGIFPYAYKSRISNLWGGQRPVALLGRMKPSFISLSSLGAEKSGLLTPGAAAGCGFHVRPVPLTLPPSWGRVCWNS